MRRTRHFASAASSGTTRWPTPTRTADSISGEVIFVDHFGNLISNISGSVMANLPADARVTAAAGVPTRRVRTYADSTPGELVSLVSSSGLLEVAVVQGNAAHKLGARVGTPVHVEWHR